MEAFNGPRWKQNQSISYRRGAMHGIRGSFNIHLPRLNSMERNNWGRNNMNGSNTIEVWNNVDELSDHQCLPYHPTPPPTIDIQMKLSENGYGHNKWPISNPHVSSHPRMEFHPRRGMSEPPYRGGRPFNEGSRGGPFAHHPRFPPGNVFHQPAVPLQQHQPLPVPLPLSNTPPADVSVSPLGQEPRLTDSPLSSFPSPSSTESDGSSPVLPRDPRQRSYRIHTPTASPLYNNYQQDKASSPSLLEPPQPIAPSFGQQQQLRQNGSAISQSYHHHKPFHIQDTELPQPLLSNSITSSHSYVGHGRRGQMLSADHSFFKNRENCDQQHLPRVPVIRGVPVVREKSTGMIVPRSRMIASERVFVEHSYHCNNKIPSRQLVVDNRTVKPLFNWSHHTSLMQSTSTNIPLPTHGGSDHDKNRSCHLRGNGYVGSTNDVVLPTKSNGKDENCVIETVAKSDRESVPQHVLPTNETKLHSGNGIIQSLVSGLEKDHNQPPTATNTTVFLCSSEKENDQVKTQPDCTKNDEIDFSISPPSLQGFEIDLDSEIDSSITSSPTLPSDDEFSPLSVSYPLTKVNIPTKFLLKPSFTTSKDPALIRNSPLVQEKSTYFRERIQTRERLIKQQNDTMQLRNRALPRNLYLFASRKAPSRAKEDAKNETSTTVDLERTANKDIDSLSHGSDEEVDVEIITDGPRDSSQDRLLSSEAAGDDESVSRTRPAIKRSSSSPGPSAPPAKVSRKTPSPEPALTRKKVCKFQDFVPIVLKSRSRAENKTIQRRQKMVIEMQNNEKERQESAVTQQHPDDSPEESISYRTRGRAMRRRDKTSPLNSQDDTSSVASGSVDLQQNDQGVKEFPPELVNRYKRMLLQSKDKTGSGDTPLHHFCRKGKHDILLYMLTKEQYNINVQDNAGWTPLHEACNKGHRDIVELLLLHGADPNIPAGDGTRPIHDAVEAGNFEIVAVLVNHGADPMIEYSERTPLEIAKSSNFQEIASYLTEVCERRRQQSSKQQVKDKPEHMTTRNTAALNTANNFSGSIRLPVDGYSEPLLGPELDKPVFYVSATIEMSTEAMLPVYNLIVSSGSNPRKHNFHVLNEVLEQLDSTKEDLLAHVGINTYSITVGDFVSQVRNNQLTKNAKILQKLKLVDKSSKLEMIPLCDGLQELMSIRVENIDD